MIAIYIVTVLVFLVMLKVGYRLNRVLRRKSPDKSDVGLGGTVAASLAPLAFLLAFVIGYVTTIFNERRHLVVEDANASEKTYLRAGYLDEPYRDHARRLLREYTDLRVQIDSKDDIEEEIARSRGIQEELWPMPRRSRSPAPHRQPVFISTASMM